MLYGGQGLPGQFGSCHWQIQRPIDRAWQHKMGVSVLNIIHHNSLNKPKHWKKS